MFRHVVLIDFVPGLPEGKVAEIAGRVHGLPAAVASVVAASCGRDAGVTAGGSDFAIVVDLASAADYPGYVADPAHDELVAVLGPCVKQRSVVDFEV